MSYINEDLAAVPQSRRTWGTWNFAALWISMSLCIPTYLMASGLIQGGMNWWEALLTILLGNAIVLVPMLLNGHAGAAYGIPFPVFVRASFGLRGANVPAMLRAVVACGWFGIQTWLGGLSLFQMIKIWVPGIATLPPIFPAWVGLDTGPAITFFAFWLLNLFIIYLGVDSIRKLLLFKAVALPAIAVALLFWALSVAHGIGPILSRPSTFKTDGAFWVFFFPQLTANVAFWATLSLNIPDFTRYAKSQRSHLLGQTLGLPPSMTLFAFLGIIVTSATSIVFGQEVWNPVDLAGRFSSPLLVSFAMLSIVLSTLATNIAANIVSPANDFSNLAPRIIDFRRGGYLTGLVGLLIFPWKLLANNNSYVFVWLIAYSALLAPIGAIMVVDYYFIRRRQLAVNELYDRNGRYWYQGGFNKAALITLVIAVLPNVPGFLVRTNVIPKDSFPAWVNGLYDYAWFVGFAIAGGLYWGLMGMAPEAAPAAAVAER